MLIALLVAFAAFHAKAAELPTNTCIVSGSLERTPAASASVTFSGALDSVWRAISSVIVTTVFYTQGVSGMSIIFR